MYERQEALLPQAVIGAAQFVVIGCGGIGSHVAVMLARMGARRVILMDDDTVEAGNVPSQAYSMADVGRSKVEACADIMRGVLPPNTAAEFETRMEKWTPDNAPDADVVVCGVDVVETQAQMWAHYGAMSLCQLYTDGRFGGDVVRAYSIHPSIESEKHNFERTLYSEAEADSVECGGRAVAYGTQMASAFMCEAIRKHLMGLPCWWEVLKNNDGIICN